MLNSTTGGYQENIHVIISLKYILYYIMQLYFLTCSHLDMDGCTMIVRLTMVVFYFYFFFNFKGEDVMQCGSRAEESTPVASGQSPC